MKHLTCVSSDGLQQEPALWSGDTIANRSVDLPHDCFLLIFLALSKNISLINHDIRNFFLTCRRTYELRLQYLHYNERSVSQLMRMAHFPTRPIPSLMRRSFDIIGRSVTEVHLENTKQNEDEISSLTRMFNGFRPFSESWLETILQYFPNIKTLIIRNILVPENQISQLKNFEHLECLAIDNVDCTDVGLVTICRLETLKALSLRNCEFSEECIYRVFSTFKKSRRQQPKIKLSALDIMNCPGLTNRSTNAILSSQTKLNELSLRRCSNITNYALLAIAQVYKNSNDLEKLDIVNCPNLTDASLTYVSNIQSITYLSISLCKKMTCKAISRLQSLANSLKTLSLSRLPITNKTVKDLNLFTLLETVDLSFCKEITNLESTIGSLPSLRFVKIKGSSIKETDRDKLRTKFPAIEFT